MMSREVSEKYRFPNLFPQLCQTIQDWKPDLVALREQVNRGEFDDKKFFMQMVKEVLLDTSTKEILSVMEPQWQELLQM
jgi:hypothetical protein